MNSKKEIIIRLTAMGDILLTIPLLRAMQAHGTQVHLVISHRWKDLAEFLPAKTHLFNGTGTLLKLASRLKGLKAAAMFDLQGKVASIALRNLVNAPITRSYSKRTLNEQCMAATRRYPLRFSDQKPVWQKYAMTCSVDISTPDPRLELTADYMAESRALLAQLGLSEKKFMLIHPDASMPGKSLKPELVRAIADKLKHKVAIIGTSDHDLDLHDSCVDLRSQFKLRQLPGLMKLSAGVISSDSGPMHMARAVEVPLAAIFLQTCPSLGFAPVPGHQVLIISRELECKPCSLHGQREKCPEGHFNCQNLDLAAVSSEISEFMGKNQ